MSNLESIAQCTALRRVPLVASEEDKAAIRANNARIMEEHSARRKLRSAQFVIAADVTKHPGVRQNLLHHIHLIKTWADFRRYKKQARQCIGDRVMKDLWDNLGYYVEDGCVKRKITAEDEFVEVGHEGW